jgi:hypothetical protein
MTHSDRPSADAFWNERARRSGRRRVERTRQHEAITKGMRRPDSGTVPVVSRQDPSPPPGAGLFDDIPDDPFDDDFGLGAYGAPISAAADEPVVEHELVLEPRQTRRTVGVDPLLARIGAVVVAAVIAVPVLGALGGDDGGDDTAGAVESTRGPSTTLDTQPRRVKRAVTASAAGTAGRRNAESRAAAGARSGVMRGDGAGAAEPAEVHAIATPTCATEYEVAAGDYWVRLADASGSDLDALLSVNGATVDSELFPGDEICLPEGATTPAPSTTAPTPTTEEPTTDAPTTEPPTTDAPSVPDPTSPPPAPTTPAPTTPPPTDPPMTPAPTQPPVTTSPPPTTGSVRDIIRSVFPDHLEERALEIADRESNFDPRARNYCCYGLFQIYFEAHRSWLAGIGVDEAEDLFDPYVNSRAAYLLYQRSGGWSPWGF